jgi:hypothetical protein
LAVGGATGRSNPSAVLEEFWDSAVERHPVIRRKAAVKAVMIRWKNMSKSF